MKKFTVQCDFQGQRHPVQVYVGSPDDDIHPLHFQQQWLSDHKGGNIPAEVMESFQKLQNIAKENDVSFEELCMYAFGQASEEKKTDETSSQTSDNK